jgi:putative acetyltransferase
MSEWLIEQVTVETEAALKDARALFAEYHGWLGEVVCSKRLAEEIATLPGPYVPAAGRLLLARDADARPAGVVGVRPFEGATCEMKRLYVRPFARGAGLGRLLASEAIGAAQDLGYTEVLLTTLPDTMGPALELYRSLGFSQTAPFADHSHVEDGVAMLFMRLSIDG